MKFLFSLFFALIVSGCASSRISSYADQSVLPAVGFSHVIITASNFPLGERQAVESAMVQAFLEFGVKATPGTDITPPTGGLGPREVDQRIADSGADSILLIYELDRSTIETYVPPQVLAGGTSSTTGSIRGYNGMYSINTYTNYSAPTVVGGYTTQKPTAKYGASLFDLRQGGRRVWIAEIDTRGSAFATYSDLAENAGQATFERLLQDGVLFNRLN
jgi:hypothetical protein